MSPVLDGRMRRIRVSLWLQQSMVYATAGLVAAAAGGLVVSTPTGGIVLAGAVTASLCPRWCLLAGAIAAALVFPMDDIGGGLRLSDPLLGAYLVRAATTPSLWVGPRGEQTVHRWLALFLGWAWLSLVVTGSETTGAALARVSLYAIVLVVAARDSELARPLLRAIVVIAIVEVMFGLSQVDALGSDRLVGTRDDPHELGILLLAGLAATPTLPASWRLPAAFLLVVGLFLTFTRAVWAAGLVELALLALPGIRGRARPIAVAAAIVGVGVALLPAVTEQFELNPESIVHRQESIRAGLQDVADHPIFGLGWALGGAQEADQRVPYNMWVNLAASTGVFGVVFFSMFLLRGLAILTARSVGREGVAVALFVLGFCVLSLASMPIYAAGSGAILFFVMLGAGLGSASSSSARLIRTRSDGAHRSDEGVSG